MLSTSFVLKMMKLSLSLNYAIVLATCLTLCSEATVGTEWQPATATMYGDLHGAGSEGNHNYFTVIPEK